MSFSEETQSASEGTASVSSQIAEAGSFAEIYDELMRGVSDLSTSGDSDADVPPPQVPRHEEDHEPEVDMTNATIFPRNMVDLAYNYNRTINYSSIRYISIETRSNICAHCGALKFPAERPTLCCDSGRVRLESFPPPPEPYLTLFQGGYPASENFLSNIRKYNMCFNMTSFGANIEHLGGFMPTVRIQGQVYHRIGPLLPDPDESPQFLQIYFIGDSNMQIDHRTNMFTGLDRNIVACFQRLLDENNSLIRQFRTNLERTTNDQDLVVIYGPRPPGAHRGVFNPPVVDEVGVLMIGGERNERDIHLRRRGGGIHRIREMNGFYDALQYPLIFWKGNKTFESDNMDRRNNEGIAAGDRRITCCKYYAFHLMSRGMDRDFLLLCRGLLNQFVTDMWAKVEGNRLRYLRANQEDLRAENYDILADAIAADADPANIGRVVLPSTFMGGPRHMHEYTQDAMTYVRKYGRPDLFITFTCNPNWHDITTNLLPNQKASDRPDIVARVFKLKQSKLMEAIKKYKIFGQVRCHMFTIEFQKRGLPHSHNLIWLQSRLRLEDIDRLISAELPDPARDPVLFSIVIGQMIHEPCGIQNRNAVCLDPDTRRCLKRYPRSFLNATVSALDGYPLYRRRAPEQGGNIYRRSGFPDIDNRWVVPHSPVLLRMFEAHINVEYCHSVKSIKYVCKYINKGSDMARFRIGQERAPVDEIEDYVVGRYISSSEACWRLFAFSIHDRFPPVVHLAVHLENGQRTYFRPGEAARRAAEPPPRTTLTEYFRICNENNAAAALLYSEMPEHFTWNPTRKCWSPRGLNLFALGRMYTVSPRHNQCFYLRLLLTKIRGPRSFEDLRTVDGVLQPTYQDACRVRGYLEDDLQYISAMEEAVLAQMPSALRILFAIIISNCSPADPKGLWHRFKHALSEDLLRRLTEQMPNNPDISEIANNQALIIIEDKCLEMCGKLLMQLNMDAPNREIVHVLNSEIVRESNYDLNAMRQNYDRQLATLNSNQRSAFNTITDAIRSGGGRIIFLDAPGGTGKTYLLNLILSYVRLHKKIILAVASSGVAATLLQGGKTAHSMFKLPLNLAAQEFPVCNISRGTSKAQLLTETKAIVWDECTMAHRKSVEALDRTLKDLRRNDLIMGGLVLILAGDFRQTLPVIPKSTPADVINACLKRSPLWRQVTKISLTINIRAQSTRHPRARAFADSLMMIGDGRVPLPGSSLLTFPTTFCQRVESIPALIDAIFADINNTTDRAKYLSERAILAPKNDAVNEINSTVLSRLTSGQPVRYFSIDTTLYEADITNFPVEVLNSFDAPGLPQHLLVLKVGAVIIMLRNLDPPRLCNGTRLIIRRLHRNVLEAEIISGPSKGTIAYIPRIPLITSDLVVEFKRVQFPVRLAFGLTINKAQGQTLKTVGLQLLEPCFSHGQLYVACSRVGSPDNLFILTPDGRTSNVVYREVL